jgi:hypothetical protein
MTAHSYSDKTSVVGWYMSRKLNGFALLWDGGITRGMRAEDVPWYVKGGDDRFVQEPVSTGLWTRRGKVVKAPDWWLDKLPVGFPVQGEAWNNDDKGLASVCNCKDTSDPRWFTLQFLVYNYKPYEMWFGAGATVKNSPYYKNERFALRLEQIIDAGITVLPQTMVINSDHFKMFCDNAIYTENWEGVMLHNPRAYYENNRSYNLLKMKSEYDTEVTIVGYEHGNNSNEGKMGSLKCSVTWDESVLTFHGGKSEFVNETYVFNVGGGFSSFQREWDYVNINYHIGKVIKIGFNEIGNLGAPPSARILED